MKWFKKTVAGLLLLWGIPISVWAAVDSMNPQSDNREGAVAALIIFGLPPTALGGWLVWTLRQDHKTMLERGDQALERIFLQLLQENRGVVNPILFATKTQLSLEASTKYLDEKALQLNGLYEATDQGGIEYRFPL
ncbi:MAG: hypothetical protein AAGH78_03520 [Cyanobacteria bacterium P01_H01_bin.58]